MLAAGRDTLLVPKQKHGNVTVAVALLDPAPGTKDGA